MLLKHIFALALPFTFLFFSCSKSEETKYIPCFTMSVEEGADVKVGTVVDFDATCTNCAGEQCSYHWFHDKLNQPFGNGKTVSLTIDTPLGPRIITMEANESTFSYAGKFNKDLDPVSKTINVVQ